MAKNTAQKPAHAKPKSRSVVPIPSTITNISGYPNKLVIFQVGASPFWWVRTYMGKPIKRSTKTTVKREAIIFAKNFFDQLIVDERRGLINGPKKSSFGYCAELVIADDEASAKRGDLAETYVISQRGLLRNHIAEHFNHLNVADIDYAELDKFKNRLFEKKLLNTSVKAHFVAVKKVLDYAQKINIIKTNPLLPRIKNEDNPRGYFTLKEYYLLRKTTRELVGTTSEVKQRIIKDGQETTKKLRNIIVDDELAYLIPFMVYSFIRPTDIKTIKHKHVEIKRGEYSDYLWLPIPATKRHSYPMTSMPRAALYYKKLRDLRLKQLGDPNADIDDDYVFMPNHDNRKYAYRQIARRFDVVLKEADLKNDEMGDVRTLYSLRHTSLMYRMKYGGEIDALKLARNARTSVEMLERFYLSRLESSQFTEVLHAKKQNKRSRKQSSIFTTSAREREIVEELFKAEAASRKGGRKLKVVLEP